MAYTQLREQRTMRNAWRFVLCIWILFIWIHSMFPGPVSSGESMMFVTVLKPIFHLFGVFDAELMHHIVRKCAHFTEYLILAVLSVLALEPRLRVPWWPAVQTCLIWVIVPVVDESIQLHVPGRGGSPVDVLIDMSGFALGLVISLTVRHIREARGPQKGNRRARGQHVTR